MSTLDAPLLTDPPSSTRPETSSVLDNAPCFSSENETGVDNKQERDMETVRKNYPGILGNSQIWPRAYKWYIICTIFFILNATIASYVLTAAMLFAIPRDLRTNTLAKPYQLIFVLLLGAVSGSIIWGIGSKYSGIKPFFVMTSSAFVVLFIGQMHAQNSATFLGTRFLIMFFGVAPLMNTRRVIADLWTNPLIGPLEFLFRVMAYVGPVFALILKAHTDSSKLSMQWFFWTMFIFSVFCAVAAISIVPEAFDPVLLLRMMRVYQNEQSQPSVHAEHWKKERLLKAISETTVFLPFRMLLQEPIINLITIYMFFVYSLVFCLFATFRGISIYRIHFSSVQDGFMLIFVAGTTLGAFISHYFEEGYSLFSKSGNNKGFRDPESRLYGAMVGSIILGFSALLLGLTGENKFVPWYVAGFSTMVLGISFSLISVSFPNYIIDSYRNRKFSFSALFANLFVTGSGIAAFTVFTMPIFTEIGFKWCCILIGLASLLLSQYPFFIFKYGHQMRSKSRFAS